MTETQGNPLEELVQQKDAEINDLHLVIGEQTVKMRRQFEYINRLEDVARRQQTAMNDLQARIDELSPEPVEEEGPELELVQATEETEAEAEEEGEEK